MKRSLLAIATIGVATVACANDVAVSIGAGQPGFYGRIDIGSVPQAPQLIYAQPVVIRHVPAGVMREPIYLHVPPGHAKHWSKHCAKYHACDQPVYFVHERWYNDVYVTYYRNRPHTPAPVVATVPAPTYAYSPPTERFYEVPVASVRAIVGAPEQRCWVERQQIVEDTSGPNIPGAIVGGVIGGVLGHQVGSGRGRDVATAGGAVAGAAIGANVGRGGTQVYSQDVQRCTNAARAGRPEYWEVTYRFRGVLHRVQMSAPPGPTITVNGHGEPRA